MPTKSNKGDKEVIYQVKLIHDPIKLNYWHAELTIFDFIGQPLDRNKKANYLKELLFKRIKELLIRNSYDKVELIPEISPNDYNRLYS